MVESIPLFPLGTVLLPGAALPLHIFEPRYRALTTDLVTGAVPGKSFGVVAVRSGRDGSEGDTKALHEVGCSARLKEVSRLPDGRFDIVTTGQRRFKVLAVEGTTASYLSAEVEWLPDEEMSAQESQQLLPRLVLAARAAHHRYCEVAWKRDDWTPPADEVEAALLSHLLAADCLLTLEDRQALLEERSGVRRLQLVRRVISRETHILSALRAIPVPLEQILVPVGLN